MAEHGILFQDEMVRALRRPVGDPLRKTVTRRTSDVWAKRKPGDLLWVRECWATDTDGSGRFPPSPQVSYRASGDTSPDGRWRPGIHMPRWASRMTLRVVDVRREHGAPCTVTHRWVGPGAPEPQRTAVFLYGRDLPQHGPSFEVPGYARAPHPGEPLPWVDDDEARREGVADRAAYLALWESINGDTYPEWVWRIEFEEGSRLLQVVVQRVGGNDALET